MKEVNQKRERKEMKKMGKFIKNHDRSLRKARANVPLNNLTANTKAPPAKVKNLSFPTPGVVGCKIPTYQKKKIKKKYTGWAHGENLIQSQRERLLI